MPLRDFMTTTASTTRHPAISGGKRSTPVTNLTNLKITPVMMSSNVGQHATRMAQGLPKAAVHRFETYTESHTHTDSGVSVTQLPDIREDDRLVVGSITYVVVEAEIQPATSGFGATLLIYLDEEKSA